MIGTAVVDSRSPAEPESVDVCICTHRRPALLIRLLESLGTQVGAPAFRVVVVDNDDRDTLRSTISARCAALSLPLIYVHAPAHDLAVARNAALDASTAPLLAFCDDDQVVGPDWLATLAAALSRFDAVFGPVAPQYPESVPDWLRLGAFHRKQLDPGNPDARRTGFTANVLIRRDRTPLPRFDATFGRSGGEDTCFFAEWFDRGARFGWCPDAEAREYVDGVRVTWPWLTMRAFASGHIHGRVQIRRGFPRAWLAVSAGAKWSASVCATVLAVGQSVRWRQRRLRAALHAGVVAAALGLPGPTPYGVIDPASS